MNLENPRKLGQEAVKSGVSKEVWEENRAFVDRLKKEIAAHPVTRHEAIEELSKGAFDKEGMKRVHLEYRHAIVQIFTDALLMAQFQSRQLEPRLAPGTKMLARFLLTLNDLDEFGFKPGTDSKGYYLGNPALAHYPLFEKLLDDYGIGEAERQNYTPSEIANDLRNFLEDTYSDFTVLTAMLAVAEQEVCIFSPPLRQGTAKVGLKVDDGYYFVHGTSDEEEVNAFDDDHEDDLWFILMQAMTPDDHAKVREKVLAYCDLWDRFWDHQLNFRENAVETSVS